MKKFKKGVVIRRLRRLLSEVVKLRDKVCQRCGRDQGKLDCSHIFPKGSYPAMQFLPENVKLLCFSCHRNFWHLEPLLASDWVKGYLGEEKYRLLVETAQRRPLVDRLFLEQAEIKLKELKAELLGAA